MKESPASILNQAATLPPLTTTALGHLVWTPAHDDLLGQACDRDLAQIWRVSFDRVYLRRRRLNKTAYAVGGGVIHWTAAMLRLLGRLPDPEVGDRFGIAASSVGLKRHALGISPCPDGGNRVRWTPTMIAELGKRYDRDIAATYGIGRKAVQRKRQALRIPRQHATRMNWRDSRVLHLLGTAPDQVIARQLGASQGTICRRRRLAGIPAFRVVRWTPALQHQLGRMPDAHLARAVGVTTTAIRWRRLRAGLPTYTVRKPTQR